MRLYGFWRSIATYRVRVALLLKKLPFEEVDVDLLEGQQFAEAFLAVNPGAAVPALEIDGRVLTQSFAIIEALDALHPETGLFPDDPFLRAEAVAMALDTVADAHPLIVPRVRKRLAAQFGADEAAIREFAAHFLRGTLDVLEERLTRRPASPFAFGETPGMADVALAGHVVSCGYFEIETDAWPKVHALAGRLSGLKAFAAAHPLRRKEIATRA